MARYDEFKAEWERRRDERIEDAGRHVEARPQGWQSGWVSVDTIETGVGGGNWLVAKPDLPQDAIQFPTTLRTLGYHLQDQRYHDLHSELLMSDLIDRTTGKWLHFEVNPETRLLFEQIEDVVSSGVSDREAIALAIVEFDITGHGFDAVHKRLERLLGEYRERVGQTPVNDITVAGDLGDAEWQRFKDKHRMTPAETEAVLVLVVGHLCGMARQLTDEVATLSSALHRRTG